MLRIIGICFVLLIAHLSLAITRFQWSAYFNHYHYAQTAQSKPYWNRSYTHFVGKALAKKKSKHWFYHFDSQFQIGVYKSKEHYISIQEANIGYHLKDIAFLNPYLSFIQVSLGRYNHHWSWMDEHWHLGLWNPRNLYDPLRPLQQGFVGSAITFGGKYWYITNFSTGIFLPDQTPSLQNDSHGKFQSNSRWALLPPSNVTIFNRSLQSDYWIQKPYIKNVLLRSSYLGKFFVGNSSKQWISLSYANKPLNQLLYAVEANLLIPQESLASNIHYHSLRHQLVELDMGWRMKHTTIRVGLMKETFLKQKSSIPDDWITPLLKEVFLSSISISQSIPIATWFRSLLVVSYLRSGLLKTKNPPTSNLKLDLSSVISFDRLKIKDGFSIMFRSKLRTKKRKLLNTFIRYWHSLDQNGGLLECQLSIYILKKLLLNIELDILGTAKNYQEGFFSKYGSNDRVMIGVQYDF